MIITTKPRTTQCQKPSGLLGKFVLWNMNSHHSKVTDWGLSHISIDKHETVLDVGCGGGRTVNKLAAMATVGKVYGVDFSKDSVGFASRLNRALIKADRVEIREGSVSQLPFAEDMFDVVTAVETHFWWPDLENDLREVLRVIKPGGRLIIIAEIYRGAPTAIARLAEKHLPFIGMKLLTIDQHRELLTSTGYEDVQVTVDPGKGWICCVGRKPAA